MHSSTSFGPEIAESAGPVVLELLEWVETKGHIRPGRALKEAKGLARAASQNLPRAEKLSTILYEVSRSEPLGPVVEDRDIDYDVVTISRVEPGRLRFRDPDGEEIGPLAVPEAASDLALHGWEVSATHFVRTARAWHLVELGNVYPR